MTTTTATPQACRVRLVADVCRDGGDAPTRPMAAAVESTTLAIRDNVGYPALVLADGSVSVLRWAQLRGLRDEFDRMLAMKEPA